MPGPASFGSRDTHPERDLIAVGNDRVEVAHAVVTVLRAAQPSRPARKFGERGIMDIIGLIGYYDLVSVTLIAMLAEAPNDSVFPLPPLVVK